MKIRLTADREVCNFGVPYTIAEIGANHNGDMEMAKRLIRAAKEAGADCVKFQSWSKDSINSRKVYQDNYFLKDDYRNRADFTLEQIVEKFSLSQQQLLLLKQFADGIGIDWISTPFSMGEADYLVRELDVPFLKVASMDLNNDLFLKYIASFGKPVLLSTGLSQLDEIDRAIRIIEDTGNKQIVILHCVSIYPPEDEQVHLNNIDTLMKLYPYPVGFSDHTLGVSIPLAAVAKGACIVEKHFTLDKSLFGWDHKISADRKELEIICSESRRINRALGGFRIVCEESQERKDAFRRSIVLKHSMKLGQVVRESDIDFKRPGTGIQPGEYRYVIGRTLNKNVDADTMLRWEDLV